jgi:hypothetical protein
MKARTSTKGQIVLPNRLCQYTCEIIIDPVTGLPVLSAGPDSPILTSKEVQEMLANFP